MSITQRLWRELCCTEDPLISETLTSRRMRLVRIAPRQILYIITASKPYVQNTWTYLLTLQYHPSIAPVEASIGLCLREITRGSKRLKELNHVGTI